MGGAGRPGRGAGAGRGLTRKCAGPGAPARVSTPTNPLPAPSLPLAGSWARPLPSASEALKSVLLRSDCPVFSLPPPPQ